VKIASRSLTVGTLVTLISLAGCVWDPGMRGEHGRYRNHDRQGTYSQHDDRDRNGQPCDQQSRDSDNYHNDDCRNHQH
jgi:hypothetical protein